MKYPSLGKYILPVYFGTLLVYGVLDANVFGIVAIFSGLVLVAYITLQKKIILLTNAYWAGHVDDIIFKASKVRDDMVELIE